MFLILAVLLSLVVLAVLARPILQKRGAPNAAADQNAAMLKERLSAVEQDLQAGLIEQKAAEEAVIEIKRAALAAESDGPQEANSRSLRFAAICTLAAAPVVVGWIYISVGSPALIAVDTATPAGGDGEVAGPLTTTPEAMTPQQRQAMIENMVAGLSNRLVENPEDAEGWRMLARSQAVLGRFEESAESYRSLLSRVEGEIDDWRNFATVLISKQEGGDFPSSDEFLSVLDEIDARSADDPFTLFYRGGAARELGDVETAAQLWRRLLGRIPEDAPVRTTLEGLIEEMEGALNANQK